MCFDWCDGLDQKCLFAYYRVAFIVTYEVWKCLIRILDARKGVKRLVKASKVGVEYLGLFHMVVLLLLLIKDHHIQEVGVVRNLSQMPVKQLDRLYYDIVQVRVRWEAHNSPGRINPNRPEMLFKNASFRSYYFVSVGTDYVFNSLNIKRIFKHFKVLYGRECASKLFSLTLWIM